MTTSTLDADSNTGEGRLPRWPARLGLGLCAIGFGLAGYLTFEHFTSSASLSCPAGGGMINCLKVTTSQYSMIHGVPVAVLGLVFFAVMTLLQLPRAWASRRLSLRALRVLWALVGVGTAVWLIYAELFKLQLVCLWCTSVHVISLILFAATVFGTVATAPLPAEEAGEVDAPPVAEAVRDNGHVQPHRTPRCHPGPGGP